MNFRNRDDETEAGPDPLWYRVGQSGKAGYALLWLLGVPIPVLLIIYAVRGCH